ncbi:hypothetical protein HKD28_14255 [Gluconobacter sp. LMG 1744]|uniref:hypothetical protein n=1 Tax=Gluconobacter TaxID=441 RepID=UPI001884AC21|nr:hypothetical protein [Gluconobacter cadivus]MBF0892562.1 hypothetical protein [Gluconobacter cadivus]
MSPALSYALATLFIAGGGALLYACSANQKLLNRPLQGNVSILLGVGSVLAGTIILTTTTSFCTACLMGMTLLMIVWCLLPLGASLLAGRSRP